MASFLDFVVFFALLSALMPAILSSPRPLDSVDRTGNARRVNGSAESHRPDVKSHGGCGYNQWACQSGDECIPWRWQCDVIVDCADGSDENMCFECDIGSRKKRQAADSRRRPIGTEKTLVPWKWICDGIRDCVDGRDELNCDCGQGLFSCLGANGVICVSDNWKCDHILDCKDYKDESTEECGPLESRCWPGAFECAHGEFCVWQEWHCDGSNDCGDGSDEINCGPQPGNQNPNNPTPPPPTTTTAPATTTPVPPGVWSSWTDWSQCSEVCDGETTRTRVCVTARPCEGPSSETTNCGTPPPCIPEPLTGCGTRQVNAYVGSHRIIGGSPAAEGAWPWLVQLKKENTATPYCGSVLIDSQWVATAAHCIVGMGFHLYPDMLKLMVGKHYLTENSYDPYEQTRKASHIIIHASYNQYTVNNDIALIKMNQPVEFAEGGINFICLPESGEEFDEHATCYTAGWGLTEKKVQSHTIQEVKLPIVPHDVCNQPKSYNSYVTDKMLCAGKMTGGKDTCQGDSGGPLVCEKADGRWYLVGITSWGRGCGEPNYPGVYTKVSMYMDWIRLKMDQNK
ncbi:PREDICTED: transmembrane protease serine 6-like [Branchiostoma belcheri]|uniref:Transmembrane protease serine 6-like n=1 Tax=Branchiostoma belcheri TaxID=7741 RepID=A0A6P4XWZ7_BRABE|nr:PREDICTED: transmembrane protease serine 6-like [Branchiostoma belcheri]